LVHAWSVGDHLTHRFNPELGTGRVTAINGRVIVVEFPGATLQFAANSEALIPETERATRRELSLIERLAAGAIDEADDFLTRLDILHLLATREADGLGSFLGGRVHVFPHQLHVAERATMRLPVRWLLADEVGLGKTIEAALIMNRLLHTQKIERCLVVAPEALTVQWLGELWRKYHQVFTLLDPPRLADVDRDFGVGFNPFDVHRRAVIALETLVDRPELATHAVNAGIDLLVVDEAQRLRRPAGHPGEPGYRAVAPIAALGRHVLLLSATPLEDDAHGFFRLLQLLRPDEFPENTDFEARLASGVPLPPCTSSTRRVDIGGLPPRVATPVDLAPTAGYGELAEKFRVTLANGPEGQRVDPIAKRRALDRIRRALASGAALKAVLGSDETELRLQADAMDAADPRLEWLVTNAKRWRRANEKTLVFVAHRETRSAATRRSRAASFTRSSPLRDVISKSRGFMRRMVRPSWCRRRPAVRDATSSSATGWCSTTCRGSRPRWNSASDASIASDAGCRCRSSISARSPASVRTSCGCSNQSDCSASRWPDSSRSWRTLSAQSKRSRSMQTHR
jgi:ATP-dependent helicase HepA